MSARAETHRGELVIERGASNELDQLRPLWDAMQEHHASVASRVRRGWRFRSNADSWTRRRASYEGWLEHPDAFLLIARLGEIKAGYLLGRRVSGWTVVDTGPQIGAIESLSVHAHHRGDGIGGLLIERAYREFT